MIEERNDKLLESAESIAASFKPAKKEKITMSGKKYGFIAGVMALLLLPIGLDSGGMALVFWPLALLLAFYTWKELK